MLAVLEENRDRAAFECALADAQPIIPPDRLRRPVNSNVGRPGVEMLRFTTSIESSVLSGNWFAALFMALALPDICASLESPDRPVGERYKDWFQRFLKPAYDPSSMFEMLAATSPQSLERMPDEVIEFLKRQTPPSAAAFTAEDCYRLRCKCLHQGLPERMGKDRIHFTAPDPNNNINIHRNSFNGVLQISIDQFCRDVSQAVGVWWSSAKQIPEVAVRAENLIKIYGLDAKELPIVRYGTE